MLQEVRLCEQPLTLWLVEMICDALSVPMVTIKSTANENQREEAARSFVAADSGVAVLAVTFKVGGCGLNLHHHCSRVVVMETPKNLNTLWQACGRVHRIGQGAQQKVWILSQRQSIEAYLEWNNSRKAVPQVAAEAQTALRPRLDAAVASELSKAEKSQGELDADPVRAVTTACEQRVLEEAAAELLQGMLGQAQSRLLFSGMLKDCCDTEVGPFTPMTPKKPRKRAPGKRTRDSNDGEGRLTSK